MQGVSRESLASARERLNAAAAGATSDELVRLAGDLGGVAQLLVSEPALRRALADSNRPAADREGLIDSLFSSHLSTAALSVVRGVAADRWARTNDLVDAIELLAIDTELAAADSTDVLADVEDELFRFNRVVSGDPALSLALSDTSVSVNRRAALVSDLLSGKAHDVTVRLVGFALSRFGGRGFEPAMSRLVELAAAHRDRQVAYVSVAAPLSDEQETRLAARLAEVYGRQISLNVQVEPSLLGGATVRVGDDLYDGSLARRLERARTELSA